MERNGTNILLILLREVNEVYKKLKSNNYMVFFKIIHFVRGLKLLTSHTLLWFRNVFGDYTFRFAFNEFTRCICLSKCIIISPFVINKLSYSFLSSYVILYILSSFSSVFAAAPPGADRSAFVWCLPTPYTEHWLPMPTTRCVGGLPR